ncbi:hypothetical protein SETIT_2G273200v2 [Setaria italica]|uniref:Uncharacterized protein n=1 Tax=Setaria italica TaxID=4555 RepID=A0A368Q466_SETIT|nr:hypothetical protein SETIT_2G273200v2 [Setaria italica]
MGGVSGTHTCQFSVDRCRVRRQELVEQILSGS